MVVFLKIFSLYLWRYKNHEKNRVWVVQSFLKNKKEKIMEV